MKKFFFIFILSVNSYFFNNTPALSNELSVITTESKIEYKKAYFAGGCFWCMEESFDKVKGVIKSISGYSGGHVKNPTYKQVIYEDTGHVEAVTVYYNPKLTSYEKLLEAFWENVDPFDADGQFCDKGKSYRSVVFYQNLKQKKIIENSILNIEQGKTIFNELQRRRKENERQRIIQHITIFFMEKQKKHYQKSEPTY